MKGFELYTFILCLIIFILLVGGFAIMIGYIVKMSIKLIKHGVEDERILKDYSERINKTKMSKIADLLGSAFSAVVSLFFIGIFAFSFYLSHCSKVPVDGVPVLKVVQSDSMATKNENNEYLEKNNLNDQFELYDIVFVYALPDEKDLKLYDIVVYERNGKQIIHRIVGIEEPNEKHPNERYFLLQGDAIQYPDSFPVKYEQMLSIYKGEKIQFVGSFIVFLQSPAGWLCLVLVFANLFATPIITKKLTKIEEERVRMLLESKKEEQIVENEVVEDDTIKENEEDSKFTFDFKSRSFEEKLLASTELLKERYLNIKESLIRIEKIKVRRSKKYESYFKGRIPVAKLAIRGKTLNLYLNLNPQEFKETKYIFQDVSDVKTFNSTPMRIKLTSNRMMRYANELILKIVEINGFKYNPNLIILRKNAESILDEELVVDKFSFDFTSKSFETKLMEANEVLKQRYANIKDSLLKINDVKVRRSRKYETYRVGRKAIAKLVIRGKTLNAYLNLNPKEYENTKYVYKDVSMVKSYKSTPLRIRLTSERSVRYVNELVLDIVRNNNLKLNDRITNVSKKKLVKNLCIALLLSALSPISRVYASWQYPTGNAGSAILEKQIEFNEVWNYVPHTESELIYAIIDSSTVGLNNPESYLNAQIESRKEGAGFARAQMTLGSMGVNQSSQLAEDFGLGETDLSFLLQFVDSNNDDVIDYYYLYTTNVDLGTRGVAGTFSNRTPGKPTTPIGSYIYPITRTIVTKDENGNWVPGESKIGSAKSAWYDESNAMGNITQIPSWDEETWVEGDER